MRPPRVSVITFASYICCIYALKFGQYWTSFCVGNSSVSSTPYIQFLFVRPRFCLRLPSDSASRRTPLPLANSSYCQACSGLSPPSYYACRAHYAKRRVCWQTLLVCLFYCNALCEVSWLVDLAVSVLSYEVCVELEWNYCEKRCELISTLWDVDYLV